MHQLEYTNRMQKRTGEGGGDNRSIMIVSLVGAVISPRLGSTELPTSSPTYTGQTIALACLVCVAVASFVGFFVSYHLLPRIPRVTVECEVTQSLAGGIPYRVSSSNG